MNTETIGDALLCAWQVAPHAVWIQTRSAEYARMLARRNDTRLVARGVAGGFLRTFEVPRGLAWAHRLILRYTSAEKVTNARFSRREGDLRRVSAVTGAKRHKDARRNPQPRWKGVGV